jgi:hypothetical protein
MYTLYAQHQSGLQDPAWVPCMLGDKHDGEHESADPDLVLNTARLNKKHKNFTSL